MQRKIILFCAGLFIAVIGFIAYQYFTGAGMTSPMSTRDPGPIDTNLGPGASHPYIEQRDDNGQLQYVLTAERSIQKGPGVYQLIKPKATNYTGDGRVLALTSDEGVLQVEQIGPKTSPKFVPKEATLKGNVKLTIGPRETFVANSQELQPGQIQASLEKELRFEYANRLLTSEGDVKIRGEHIEFDGSDLKVLLNADQKRVELLRIEKGNKITIKGVGEQGFDLGDMTGQATAAARAAVPAAANPPTVATAPTAAPPATPAVVTTAPAVAADRQKTAYRLNFGQDVKASLGDRWMASQHLQLIFQLASGEAVKNVGTMPATPAAKGATPVATPVVTPPSPSPVAVAPTAAKPAATTAAARKEEDLVITWTGPMEMRPAGPEDAPLVNSKDAIVQALGSETTPVTLGDGEGRRAKAARLFYHTAAQQLQMDGTPTQSVEMADAAVGRIRCQGMTFQQVAGKVNLVGPGRIEVVEGAAPAEAGKPNKPKENGRGPVVATFTKALDIELASVPDPKHPGKKSQMARHAVFTGDADVQDATSRIGCDSLDVLLAHTVDAKSNVALEHVLASGNVFVRSAKTPGVVADDQNPMADSLRCKLLEVKTAVAAGTAGPQLSEVLATGDVVAIAHTVDKNDPKKVVTEQISTPRMVVTLEPKAAGAAAKAAQEGLAGFGVQEMRALDGVKIQIDGVGPQPVMASAQTLVADPRAATARLIGGDAAQGKAGWAMVKQGNNSLSGPMIMLSQKDQSAQIPGSGEFYFLQPAAKAGEAPSPVQVTWQNGMEYDGKTMVARFAGGVEAKLAGKPEQQSQLNCDKLEVRMAASAGTAATRAASEDDFAKKGRLSMIIASGKVIAMGGNLDADGNIIDRLYLRAPSLVYEDQHKRLTIPQAGDLLLEDFRPEAATRPAATQNDLVGGQGSTRGRTAFHWGESLVYDGEAGLIHMKKDIFMRHLPEKPPVTTAKVPDPKTSEVQLQCQDLTTQLLQSKGTVSNPLAFGTGGTTKVGKVTADGGSIMTVGTAQIAADVLEFNAAQNKASAYGRNGNFATMVRPEGTGAADRIEWDLTKGSGGITLINPHGNVVAP
jgi:hypothetical protein